MRAEKRVLDLFTKEDPWPVRMGALAMWLIYSLVLVVLISGFIVKSPWLVFLLKRFT